MYVGCVLAMSINLNNSCTCIASVDAYFCLSNTVFLRKFGYLQKYGYFPSRTFHKLDIQTWLVDHRNVLCCQLSSTKVDTWCDNLAAIDG